MLNKIKNQKGVSLYLALVIMTIFLGMGLGLTTILLSQKKMIRGIDYSIKALGAADTGIEVILCLDKECSKPGCGGDPCKPNCTGLKSKYSTSAKLNNNAEYQATLFRNCGINTLTAIGSYKGVSRALEVGYGESKVGSVLNEATGYDCNYICAQWDCECGQIYTDVVTGMSQYWFWIVGPLDPLGTCATNTAGCATIMDPVPSPPAPPEYCEGFQSMWTYCDCTEQP